MTTAPKNYTTSIPAKQTVGEVVELLVRHGADQVVLHYDADRRPAGVSFSLAAPTGRVGYRLPVKAEAVFDRLQRQGKTRSHVARPTREQAERVAWRTVQDWLEAQLELIANDLVSLDEVMLPFRVIDRTGTTVYQALASGQLALPAGEGSS